MCGSPTRTRSTSPTKGTAAPSSALIQGGASITVNVSTADTAGTASSVALSVSNLPSGVTGSFNPPSVTAGQSSTLTLTADNTAAFNATGTSISITGTNANFTHSTTVLLATLLGGGGGPTGPTGPQGVPGLDLQTGGIITLLPGVAPPPGYVLLGTTAYAVKLSDGRVVTLPLNVYVKS